MTFTTLKNTDATLSHLTISPGVLATPFAPMTATYDASVRLSTTSISLTATLADPHATIVLSGPSLTSPLSSGVASSPLALNLLANPTVFDVSVTAQDGVTTRTYSIRFNRIAFFEAWQHTHFGAAIAQIGYTDDFDGDGLNNLTEFAFGTLPTDNKSGGSPLSYIGNVITPGSAITEVIANKPTAEYIRRSDYLTSGLTYTVQFSAKLNTWETDTRTPTVLASDGINEVVGLIYPKLSTGAQAKFFRVTANIVP